LAPHKTGASADARLDHPYAPPAGGIVPLANAAEAHKLIESGHLTGKIVLTT
jgi:hypothetical protein